MRVEADVGCARAGGGQQGVAQAACGIRNVKPCCRLRRAQVSASGASPGVFTTKFGVVMVRLSVPSLLEAKRPVLSA